MEAEQAKNEVERLLTEAKSKFAELESEYKKFSQIREELKTKVSSIKGLHTKADTEAVKIETAAKEIVQKSTEATSHLSAISKIKSELDTYFQQFNTIKSSLNDPSKNLFWI